MKSDSSPSSDGASFVEDAPPRGTFLEPVPRDLTGRWLVI